MQNTQNIHYGLFADKKYDFKMESCLEWLRLAIFYLLVCKFARKYRGLQSASRRITTKKMRGVLAATLIIMEITISLCKMRKTIKVLKFPKIGKFGGFDKSVAIYDFDPGDQKEATMCMKIRTFAYNEGLGCPFYLHTKVDWAEAKDIFAWQYCVGWKTGLEDYNKQVNDTTLFLA